MITIKPVFDHTKIDIYPLNHTVGVESSFSEVSICPEYDDLTINLIEDLVILGGETVIEEPKSTMVILKVTELEVLAGTNRVVRKEHGLNVALVDVSIFDHHNNNIALDVKVVNSNEIDIDFSRANIPMDEEWSILVED